MQIAKQRGATYADFRVERLRNHVIVARDRELQTSVESETVGFSVRVVAKGAWGFAAGIDLTTEAVSDVTRRAVEVAEALAPLNTEPVMLADEPVYRDTYVSSYEIDPFDVAEDQKINFLLTLNERALASKLIDRVTSHVMLVREQKYFASLAGSRITQQRVRVKGDLTAVRIDKSTGAFETMGNAAPPAGKGWEYFTTGYDWNKDADEIPALLEQKMSSPSITPGRYDIVIDPTNLWLTIHESIGHSTELDRVLGYEANYAGTSFATLDKLNTLQFGAPMMHVTGDRQVEHGLSTIGYDDEGVAAQTWDIVRDGVLVGYQLDRQMAHKQRFGRSNGCAFADQAGRVPLQRMPNVSLSASAKPITLTDLLSAMGEGPLHRRRQELVDRHAALQLSVHRAEILSGPRRQDRRTGEGRRVSVAHDRFLELDGSRRRAVDLCARRRVQLRQRAARTNRARLTRMPRRAVQAGQHPQHRAGGGLITLQDTIDRVLRLSKADACIVIARRVASVNIRWAHNTVTTNGDADEVQLTVICHRRPPRRVGDAHVLSTRAARRDGPRGRSGVRAPARSARLHAAARGTRRAADWTAPPADSDIHVFDPLVPQLRTLYEDARRANIATFGYTEFQTATTFVATSTGLRTRCTERMGKVEMTGKTPDFARSSWVGQVTHEFLDIDVRGMFETLQQRLGWAAQRIDMPAGAYEVLLEPSPAADLAIAAYWFMMRRDADEGRSPYSKPGGGTRLGERLFGDVTMYSDPDEPAIETTPFHYGVESGSASSVFDNGLELSRSEWVQRRRAAESDHAALLGGENA